MDRRSFLKRAGLGATALTLGSLGWRIGGVWWRQPPSPQLKALSEDEAKIVEAIAGALFPGDPYANPPIPSGPQVGLVGFFDELLVGTLTGQTGDLVRLLLHAIDDAAVMADLSMTRFHLRPLAERVEILRAWETSYLAARRGAYDSVKVFMAMGYCEHPDVLAALGVTYSCGGVV
jgi:hypothetical protein